MNWLYSIPFTSLSWLPIVVFILILVIGAITGYFSGWKTSLYFLSGNLILGLIGILTYSQIYNLLIKKLVGNIFNYKGDISNLINLSSIYIGAIYLIAFLLISNLLLTFIYIFIRKHLKYKKKFVGDKPKIKNRFVGVAIATTTSFLVGVTAANVCSAAVIPSKSNNKFSSFLNSVLKTLTLKKMYGTQNVQNLLRMADLIQNDLNDLESTLDIMTGDFDFPNPVNPDPKVEQAFQEKVEESINNFNKISDKISYIFNDTTLLKGFLSSIFTLKGDNFNFLASNFTSYTETINKYKLKINKLNLNKDAINIISNYLNDFITIIPKNTSPDKKTEIYQYLLEIFIEK